MGFLDYLLGGAVGGLEGYQSSQERQRKEQQEDEERKLRLAALEATTRNEARQALGAQGKMLPADVFAKYTMPGATPMQPALSQKIGGKDFVFAPDIAQAEAHRADVMKEKATRAKKAGEEETLGSVYETLTLGGEPIIPKGQGRSLAKMPVNAQSSVIGAATRIAESKLKPQRERGLTPAQEAKEQKELAAAEAAFNTEMSKSSPLRQALVTAFNNLRANDPFSTPQELMRSALQSSKALKIPLAAPKPKADGGRTEELEVLLAQSKSRLAAGKPAAAKPSAAATPAAQPTLADAADKEARRADRWDQIKAQNPGMSDDAITAQVKREIP